MRAENEQRRDNAIRLLSLFASKGLSIGVTVANAWVLDVAAQNGFGDQDIRTQLCRAKLDNSRGRRTAADRDRRRRDNNRFERSRLADISHDFVVDTHERSL